MRERFVVLVILAWSSIIQAADAPLRVDPPAGELLCSGATTESRYRVPPQILCASSDGRVLLAYGVEDISRAGRAFSPGDVLETAEDYPESWKVATNGLIADEIELERGVPAALIALRGSGDGFSLDFDRGIPTLIAWIRVPIAWVSADGTPAQVVASFLLNARLARDSRAEAEVVLDTLVSWARTARLNSGVIRIDDQEYQRLKARTPATPAQTGTSTAQESADDVLLRALQGSTSPMDRASLELIAAANPDALFATIAKEALEVQRRAAAERYDRETLVRLYEVSDASARQRLCGRLPGAALRLDRVDLFNWLVTDSPCKGTTLDGMSPSEARRTIDALRRIAHERPGEYSKLATLSMPEKSGPWMESLGMDPGCVLQGDQVDRMGARAKAELLRRCSHAIVLDQKVVRGTIEGRRIAFRTVGSVNELAVPLP